MVLAPASGPTKNAINDITLELGGMVMEVAFSGVQKLKLPLMMRLGEDSDVDHRGIWIRF